MGEWNIFSLKTEASSDCRTIFVSPPDDSNDLPVPYLSFSVVGGTDKLWAIKITTRQ
jgi:hypothetical protein